jgi:hypothetical protein
MDVQGWDTAYRRVGCKWLHISIDTNIKYSTWTMGIRMQKVRNTYTLVQIRACLFSPSTMGGMMVTRSNLPLVVAGCPQAAFSAAVLDHLYA